MNLCWGLLVVALDTVFAEPDSGQRFLSTTDATSLQPSLAGGNKTDAILKHRAPSWHKDGPMPTISDSLFSLIILVYVSVIFIFMFFSFCWKEPDPSPPDPAHKNIPMITSMLEEMEKQEMENNQQFAFNLEHDLAAGEEIQDNLLLDHRSSDPALHQCGDPIVVSVITEKSSNAQLPSLSDNKLPPTSPTGNGGNPTTVIPDPTQV